MASMSATASEPRLPSGWEVAVDECSGQSYYYNCELAITQWHPPGGLERETQPPAANQALSADDKAEAAVIAALGYVDPVAHAVAVKILDENIGRQEAERRLVKVVSSNLAAACAEALFEDAEKLQARNRQRGESSSDSESEAELDDAQEPLWVTRPTLQEMTVLSTRELRQRVRLRQGLSLHESGDRPSLIAAYKSYLDAEEGCAGLHRELYQFCAYVQPCEAELSIRTQLLEQITCLLDSLCPGIVVEPYGSTACGLSLFNSDIDVRVKPKMPLEVVARALSGTSWARCVDLVPARVPIITFEHRHTKLTCDLSNFTDDEGDNATEVMVRLCRTQPMMQPLALFLKVFLSYHSLDRVYTGGLGSFKAYMMLGYWLEQCCKPKPSKLNRVEDAGVAICRFLVYYVERFKYDSVIELDGVATDFSRVRSVQEIKDVFRSTLNCLSKGCGLSSIIDPSWLRRTREKSRTIALSFCTNSTYNEDDVIVTNEPLQCREHPVKRARTHESMYRGE
ncbi:hypothetical protein CYMTET_29310 [Cymbomonas tetramitiformis]|uniref:WW domain-containing protein n=1 Tax=Cymbomonas tetramitiformis TaxID=36881 RepID=A0AAE0FLA5_9CHLO|nr:hypothetical protein CYMTET_29310 [Cymbomonas tetramitiformis]